MKHLLKGSGGKLVSDTKRCPTIQTGNFKRIEINGIFKRTVWCRTLFWVVGHIFHHSLKWFVALLAVPVVLWGAHLAGATPDAGYTLAAGKILVHALSHIDSSYLDAQRVDPKTMMDGALDEIQKTVPEILAQCDVKTFCSITVKNATKRFSFPEPNNINGLYKRLREIFAFIQENVAPDTETKKVEYAAIEGMLSKLDPHSNFLAPEIYNEFKIDTKGEFGGLGIVIGLRDGKLTVIAALEGTPAFKAGIKAKDVIAQIDKESTINLSLTEAVSKLRGPVGTKVAVKIERPSLNAPFDVNLTRAIINIEAVQSTVLISPLGKKIGMVRVKSFQSNTERDFRQQLNQLTATPGGLTGLILDLRNNPGGLLDQAVALADAFLTDGTIVTTVAANNKVLDRKLAKNQGTESKLPLIVLVDEGSASASEIVAGALKNNNRALIVGNTTFGKGSVQTIFDMPMETALKLTIAQYLTPGNQSIQSVGITPDVKLIPVVVDKQHMDFVENKWMTEQDLEQHLDNSATTKEAPGFELHYLSKPEKPEEEKEYSQSIKAEGDIAAQVALQLLEQAKTVDRQALLKENLSVLSEMAKKESDKIARQFQTIGVDWSVSAVPAAPMAAGSIPKGELTYQILKENKPITQVKAGDKVVLQATFKNTGTVPLEQLIGVPDTKVSLLKNLEFPFGKVMPQQSVSWSDPIEIPKMTLTEEALMTMKFEEAHRQVIAPVPMAIAIEGLPRPKFAFEYWLDTPTLTKTVSHTLSVKVTNDGQGTAKAGWVLLKNLGNDKIFIEAGRLPLTNLAPGQTQEVKLKFHVAPEMSEESFKLELAVTDPDLGVGVSRPITFHFKAPMLHPAASVRYRTPDITFNTTTWKTNEASFHLSGTAKDNGTVRDLYIFVNEKKVFYLANAQQEHAINFDAKIPLEEGNNVISVSARDEDDLTTQKFVVVRYQPKK